MPIEAGKLDMSAFPGLGLSKGMRVRTFIPAAIARAGKGQRPLTLQVLEDLFPG